MLDAMAKDLDPILTGSALFTIKKKLEYTEKHFWKIKFDQS